MLVYLKELRSSVVSLVVFMAVSTLELLACTHPSSSQPYPALFVDSIGIVVFATKRLAEKKGKYVRKIRCLWEATYLCSFAGHLQHKDAVVACVYM